MKSKFDNILFEIVMSSTRKSDVRPIAAQFRYYVSHPLSEDFQQGYRVESIEEEYEIK